MAILKKKIFCLYTFILLFVAVKFSSKELLFAVNIDINRDVEVFTKLGDNKYFTLRCKYNICILSIMIPFNNL